MCYVEPFGSDSNKVYSDSESDSDSVSLPIFPLSLATRGVMSAGAGVRVLVEA